MSIAYLFPGIIEAAGNAIASFVQTVINHLPEIVESGIGLIQALAQGLWSNIQVLLTAAADAVLNVAGTILDNLPTIIECGLELIGALISGMVTRAPHVLATIVSILGDIAKKFTEYDWASLGKRIIEGIANGLKNAKNIIVDAAKNAAKNAFDGAKEFLQIKSPSRLFEDEVGAMMAEGMAIGFEKNVPVADIQNAMNPLATAVPNALGSYNYGGFNISIYQAPGQSAEELVDIVETRINSRIRSRQAVFA